MKVSLSRFKYLHASGIKLLSRGGGVFVTAQKGKVIQRATARRKNERGVAG